MKNVTYKNLNESFESKYFSSFNEDQAIASFKPKKKLKDESLHDDVYDYDTYNKVQAVSEVPTDLDPYGSYDNYYSLAGRIKRSKHPIVSDDWVDTWDKGINDPESLNDSLCEDNQQQTQSYYNGPGRYEVYTYMGTQQPRFYKYADFMSESQYNKAVEYLGKNFAQANKIAENPEIKDDVTTEGLKLTGGFNGAVSGLANQIKNPGSRTHYLHGSGLASTKKDDETSGTNDEDNSSTGTDLVTTAVNTAKKLITAN